MSEYIFRGKNISGLHAYTLLGAVKRVMTEVPDPTLEDVLVLSEIVADFEKKFEEDMKREYPDDADDEVYET